MAIRWAGVEMTSTKMGFESRFSNLETAVSSSAGGGSSGSPATQVLVEPKSGSYYGIGVGGVSSPNTLTYLTSGVLYLTSFTPGYDFQLDAINFETVIRPAYGGLLKVVIYSNTDGQPNQKLFESSTVSTDTSGKKLLTGQSFTFNANETYWISTVSNMSIQLRAMYGFEPPMFPVIANSPYTAAFYNYRYTSDFNSLPSTMPTLTTSNYANDRIPMIMFRKS